MQKETEDCPIAIVNFKEAKVLADLGAIAQDLGFTMKTCSHLKKLLKEGSKDNILIESLWTAALIRYARCFKSGKRFGLNKNFFDGLQGEPQKVHKLYMDLRDKHIVHSVNPFEQMEVGLVLSPKNSPKKEIIGVATLSMRHITSTIDGVHQLGMLSKVLLEKVCKVAKEYEKKTQEVGKTMPIDKLYKKARPRLTAPGPDLAGESR